MMKTRIGGKQFNSSLYAPLLLFLSLCLAMLASCGRDTSKPSNLSPDNRTLKPAKTTSDGTPPSVSKISTTSVSLADQPEKLHQEALIIDAHADTIQAVLAGHNLATRQTTGQLDIPRMREGELDAEFFAIFPDPIFTGNNAVKRTEQLIDKIEKFTADNHNELQLARTAADIEQAAANHRIAILMGIEGGHAINNSLEALRKFAARGVRYMSLTWSNTNDWADACDDTARHQGLTDFGREVVREMNRLGMLVDVSHVSDKTFYDVLAVSTKPVIASHSSCRALTNHPRNLSDDMLRALAKQGGVCAINFYSKFIDKDYLARDARYAKPGARPEAAQFGGDLDRFAVARFQRFIQSNGNPAPPLESLIDHIDHAVKVAGIDHVGLGSDFDGIDALPKDLEDAAKLANITRALLKRGYSADDIKKILGGNLLRVLKEAEK